MVNDDLIEKDYDYMHLMLPEISQRLLDLIEDICDRQEYEGSFLYDECPDKTTIFNLTDKVYQDLASKEAPGLKDLIQTMLCDEILYRRCRYYHKMKRFK